MSKCISPHGEYSEHEFAKDDCVPRDRFICAWCFVFDEDAALDEIDSLRAKIARVEEECDSFRNGLSWILYQAALHHLGGAFDPVHMLAIANTAGDSLAGREMPDYTEAMEAAQERATEWAERFAEWAAEDAS